MLESNNIPQTEEDNKTYKVQPEQSRDQIKTQTRIGTR